MLNPKFLKEVSNSPKTPNLSNDDKIGNIFFNMDTFKSKLSYSIVYSNSIILFLYLLFFKV